MCVGRGRGPGERRIRMHTSTWPLVVRASKSHAWISVFGLIDVSDESFAYWYTHGCLLLGHLEWVICEVVATIGLGGIATLGHLVCHLMI